MGVPGNGHIYSAGGGHVLAELVVTLKWLGGAWDSVRLVIYNVELFSED